MDGQTVIPEWVVLLVGRLTLEAEAAKLSADKMAKEVIAEREAQA